MTEFINLLLHYYEGLLFPLVTLLMTRYKLDRILGSKQHFLPCGFSFFGPMVILIYLVGHVVFYLFGPLDSVYWTSLEKS